MSDFLSSFADLSFLDSERWAAWRLRHPRPSPETQRRLYAQGEQIYQAIRNGTLDARLLDELVAAGFPINHKINHAGYGYTALHVAAKIGGPTDVELLIGAGADPNQRSFSGGCISLPDGATRGPSRRSCRRALDSTSWIARRNGGVSPLRSVPR